MATDVLQAVPWGNGEIAYFIRKSPGWDALAAAQECAIENNGRLESLHGIILERIREPRGQAWQQTLTPNYDEAIGLDLEGRIGGKDESVFVGIQGSGIALSSAKQLQEACNNKTPEGFPSTTNREISNLLAGKLPNGQQIKVYTLPEIMKEDPKRLPAAYAIASPLKDLQDRPSGRIRVDELETDKLFIIRAGHPQTAKDYVKVLRLMGIEEHGNWHPLPNLKPENPSVHVLHVLNDTSRCSYGLGSFGRSKEHPYFEGYACFAVVYKAKTS